MKSFKGKVAAITGAASGMGRTLAVQLAREGASLSISDVDTKGLTETVKLAKSAADEAGHDIKITSQELDVSSRADMYAWADKTAKDHGKVNLIFNNAGVAYATPIEDIDYDKFDWIMGINFWGVVYGTKAFLPYLKASGEGHIINTSSLFGLCAQPTQSTYNATKFAVRGFTESLRQELDFMNCGVSATSVHPGGIKTAIARKSVASPAIEKFTGTDAESGKAFFEKFFITSAEKAADIILKAVKGNKRRVLVGPDAVAMDAMVRALPESYQAIIVGQMKKMRDKQLARKKKNTAAAKETQKA
ncbi:SDR family NAD(P)-dependent oxidoreductase [Limnobacter humi]|uniref:SDR family NAD(P)-dependent oxidoreductase n=1 Tax=Limnobacter humi TaxID=1778671 RepID=A0ABT1WDU9_9BURK|nr:SDR family NAD(P)-dependent oxidoreductase [Limnobacter humi]MCQ8895670.1 SDR family NAD(P)-dependent oxidoreductase [Limnobacter humi]